MDKERQINMDCEKCKRHIRAKVAQEILEKMDKILKDDELCCLAGRCNYNKLQALKAEYGVQD